MHLSEELEVCVLGPEHFQETLEFLVNNFFTRCPFFVMAKETTMDAPLTKYTAKDLRDCLASGTCFAARLRSTDEIVAARINQVFTRKTPYTEKPNQVSVVKCVLKELMKDIDLFREPDVHKCMEFYMLCVREDFGGRGIGAKLSKKSIEVAVQHNCQKIMVQIANSLTERIFARLGFQTIKTLRLKGQPGLDLSLAAPEDHYLKVMTKRLPPKITNDTDFSDTFNL